MIGIYKITNPKGKIYIGQSIDIKKRWLIYEKKYNKNQVKLYNSFLKYGIDNHIFEVVEECLIEELNDKEIYWGNFYNVLEDGLNLKIGNGKGILSDEIKQKIGKSNSKPKPEGFNVKMSEETKKKISNSHIGIPKGLKGRISPNKGKKWDDKDRKIYKPILQYDLDGNFIREWKCTLTAQKELNIKGICGNLNNRTQSAGGSIWKYKTEKYDLKINPKPQNIRKGKPDVNRRKEIEIFKNGLYITTVLGFEEASLITGIHSSNISNRIRNNKKYKEYEFKSKP